MAEETSGDTACRLRDTEDSRKRYLKIYFGGPREIGSVDKILALLYLLDS